MFPKMRSRNFRSIILIEEVAQVPENIRCNWTSFSTQICCDVVSEVLHVVLGTWFSENHW